MIDQLKAQGIQMEGKYSRAAVYTTPGNYQSES